MPCHSLPMDLSWMHLFQVVCPGPAGVPEGLEVVQDACDLPDPAQRRGQVWGPPLLLALPWQLEAVAPLDVGLQALYHVLRFSRSRRLLLLPACDERRTEALCIDENLGPMQARLMVNSWALPCFVQFARFPFNVQLLRFILFLVAA